ncbi:membrane-bound serine protease (ClpP class), partial [Candidatus Methanophagaceae archaeon]
MNEKLLQGIFIVLVLLAFVTYVSGESKDAENVIYVLKIEGTITEGTALEVVEGLREAEDMRAEAVLLELNTPGGIVDATRKIT